MAQNYRYYAIINSDGEKRLLDSSVEMVKFRRQSHNRTTLRGFNDIMAAQNWLATATYTNPGTPNYTWNRYPAVPAMAKEDKSSTLHIFVWGKNAPNGLGYYTILIPMSKSTYITTSTIANPTTLDSATTAGIIHAIRMAHDNGFRSVTIHTSRINIIRWMTLKHTTDSNQGFRFMQAVRDMVDHKHMDITGIQTAATVDSDDPNMYAAYIATRAVISAVCPNSAA